MRGSNVTKNFLIRSHLENRDRKNKSVNENSVLGSKRITVSTLDMNDSASERSSSAVAAGIINILVESGTTSISPAHWFTC
uniref:Uncharacterized protein n=1 Tax=Caenorhabditis japonica TaxID=281687 RepID=A0A8R1HKV2_CAEJA